MTTKFSSKNRSILNGIIQRNTIASGLIFYGQPGAMIKYAGHYYALGINCMQFDEEPCHTCLSCQSITNGTSPDIIHVNEDAIKIEAIRQLQEQVKYGPSQSKYLVVIIHNSDRFTTQAANAFLKTLEEPPEGVKFVLMTNKPLNLLTTIRSRCQSLFFPVVTTELLIDPSSLPIDLKRYFADTETESDLTYITYDQLKQISVLERFQ